MPTVCIDTHNAWVEFPIFDAKTRSLKKTFLGKAGGAIGRTGSNVVVIEALRDITLSLSIGDRMGLVGHNGAGKSTLLRLLSGIYEPTRGSAVVRGRVAPIFDLDFLRKALRRLQRMVERSGILVFAGHSNEYLARLCTTAMWIDHGELQMSGGVEEVIRAYEGEDAARHVAKILAQSGAHD